MPLSEHCYRCTICATNWPGDKEFKVCPECGEDCWPPNKPVMVIEPEEAKRRVAHARFERWLEEHGRA